MDDIAFGVSTILNVVLMISIVLATSTVEHLSTELRITKRKLKRYQRREGKIADSAEEQESNR